jgi:hypothetical protein
MENTHQYRGRAVSYSSTRFPGIGSSIESFSIIADVP